MAMPVKTAAVMRSGDSMRRLTKIPTTESKFMVCSCKVDKKHEAVIEEHEFNPWQAGGPKIRHLGFWLDSVRSLRL